MKNFFLIACFIVTNFEFVNAQKIIYSDKIATKKIEAITDGGALYIFIKDTVSYTTDTIFLKSGGDSCRKIKEMKLFEGEALVMVYNNGGSWDFWSASRENNKWSSFIGGHLAFNQEYSKPQPVSFEIRDACSIVVNREGMSEIITIDYDNKKYSTRKL
jgi:hypothetical protein